MVVISHSVLLNQLLDRSKTQTIRPIHSDYWLRLESGDELQHYWKVRKPVEEKEHHFLGESAVETVRRLRFEPGSCGGSYPVLYLNDEHLRWQSPEAEELVRRDGFDSAEDFIHFFTDQYPGCDDASDSGFLGADLEFAVIQYDWFLIPPGSPRCPSCGERYWVTEVTGGEPWTCGTCGHEAGYEAEDPEVREELPRKIAESKERSWKE